MLKHCNRDSALHCQDVSGNLWSSCSESRLADTAQRISFLVQACGHSSLTALLQLTNDDDNDDENDDDDEGGGGDADRRSKGWMMTG